METDKELLKKDVILIVQLSHKIDYYDKTKVRQVYKMLTDKKSFHTFVGEKYMTRLEVIISENKIPHTCVLCNKNMDKNLVVCNTCLSKIKVGEKNNQQPKAEHVGSSKLESKAEDASIKEQSKDNLPKRKQSKKGKSLKFILVSLFIIFLILKAISSETSSESSSETSSKFSSESETLNFAKESVHQQQIVDRVIEDFKNAYYKDTGKELEIEILDGESGWITINAQGKELGRLQFGVDFNGQVSSITGICPNELFIEEVYKVINNISDSQSSDLLINVAQEDAYYEYDNLKYYITGTDIAGVKAMLFVISI